MLVVTGVTSGSKTALALGLTGSAFLENRMREMYFRKLHRNKDVLDYVLLASLIASKGQFLRNGTFEPQMQAEAFIYENPNGGQQAHARCSCGRSNRGPLSRLMKLAALRQARVV